jgi:uncharacterized protein YlxW (UPF0749 family)
MSALAPRIRGIPSWQVTLAVALLVLGFLIATQFRAEEPRVRYTTQERGPLVETVLSLQQSQDELKDRILALNEAITTELSAGEGDATLIAELTGELDSARLAAGLVAVEGPGLVLQLEDADDPAPPGANVADLRVSGRDIRTVVDQLWLAGAEAIAVNGERVVGPTAILEIGGSILVNAAYLTPPYQIAAIGEPGMYDRLARESGFVRFLTDRSAGAGIEVSVAEPDDVLVPAYAGSIVLRYGRPEEAG